MLDTIFITNPAALLFLAAITALHILSRALSSPVILTLCNLFVHVSAIVVLVFAGASLEEILCLLLLSVAAGLWQSKTEKKR